MRNFILPLIIFLLTIPASAKETEMSFLSDKDQKLIEEITKKTGDEYCAEIWDILWPYAKEGSEEARYWLFFSMAPPPEMKPIIPPGNFGDRASIYRDFVTLSVHTQNYRKNIKDDLYRNIELSMYARFEFTEGNFMNCIKEGGENCADIAVKKKLVPSFEEFAKEIDMFMNMGMKSSCRKLEN